MVSDEIFRITYAMRQKIHQNNDREKADLGITASTFESLGFKPDAVFLQMITDCNQRTSPERTFPPQTKSQKTYMPSGIRRWRYHSHIFGHDDSDLYTEKEEYYLGYS
ncbi:hypothetical protein PtrM4_079190 [Pyrenophora tritici-repentis]|uniref:Uncharacterized protein n=1 Tax=Pyrenophora tritici-repentis TaxID=45151 RepID=A0A834RZW9_9PLEO|nr:hypothetical protein PtrM4_079190 [Pyrenophora tritici-repentis]KAI0570657.1 hypothetical protein Alg215_10918 [Pyrenophora tritici-repentis]KAI1684977.1 hypothetical protein KJE20_05261 [Pyrenophora tritici-repentis]